jgi:hypothetical protein
MGPTHLEVFSVLVGLLPGSSHGESIHETKTEN